MLRSVPQLFLLLVGSFFGLHSCSNAPPEPTPIAVHGTLDLSAWDSAQTPLIDLRGQWDFYWDELSPNPQGKSPLSIEVPGRWPQLSLGGNALPANGKATYRLKLVLPENRQALALKVPEIDRAFRLWIDGEEYPTGSWVGDLPSSEGGGGYSRYFFLPAGSTGRTTTLVFLVSSHFDSWGGGIATAPILGTASAILDLKSYHTGMEVFLSGILLIMCLYHLILFAISRKDKTLLLFGLVCLVSLWRHLVSNEGIVLGPFDLSLEFFRRWSWATGYLMVSLYIVFIDQFYPGYRIRSVGRLLAAYGVAMAAACLVLTQAFYGIGLLLHGYLVCGLVYLLFILGKAMANRDPFAGLLVLGSLSAGVPALVDVVTVSTHILPLLIAPFGVIPFVLILSYILAQRYTKGTRDAEALRLKNTQLTELDRAKTNFFANVSHELRTPLTLLLGPLDGVQKGDFGNSISSSHPIFSVMKTNAARILKLVENLLKIAKMESGTAPQKRPVDLDRTLENYLDEFRSVAATNGLSLIWSPTPAPASGIWLLDLQDLETVVFNLLSNALKFTPSGGSVTLQRELVGTQVVLRVLDTGIGIAEPQKSHIFERFQTIYEIERHQYEGTGIGLSIAQEAARRMGGQLRLTSAPGQGSSFELSFPAVPIDDMKDGAVFAPSKQAKNLLESDFAGSTNGWRTKVPNRAQDKTVPPKRVLVVEDHEDLRAFLTTLLSRDFIVLEADNGRVAMSMLNGEVQVDLILSDIMMPEMDGLSFFEEVQNLPGGSSTPFLFLTARASEEERLAQLKKGAIDYLTKPFTTEELLAKVTAILELQGSLKRDLESRILSALEGTTTLVAPPPKADLQGYALSKRELDVLHQVATGRTDKAIAADLNLSHRTVSNHVGSLLRKTGTSSRSELIRMLVGGSSSV